VSDVLRLCRVGVFFGYVALGHLAGMYVGPFGRCKGFRNLFMWRQCWFDLGSFEGFVALSIGPFGWYDWAMLGHSDATRGYVRFVLDHLKVSLGFCWALEGSDT
jgi:hypothetical protein